MLSVTSVLIVAWEVAARVIDNDLLLPSFSATVVAFVQDMLSGELVERTAA
jgi:NitT/TauT family transport system permease protein